MRKRSDDDPDKYNQLVVEDEQSLEHEYQSDYRGHVQNRKADEQMLPMFGLAFQPMKSDTRPGLVYTDQQLDLLNHQLPARTIYVNNARPQLTEQQSALYFAYIDSLTAQIDRSRSTPQAVSALFLRAVAYGTLQNYQGAVDDLSTYLQIDTLSTLALWQRAVCQWSSNQFQASQGTNVELMNQSVLADLNHALQLSPRNAYLLYNRGCLHAGRHDYALAVDDFSQAIAIEPLLAEAWYNRGLCRIGLQQADAAIADLGKAGEMGLYTAYSIIKKYSK
jgi:tetratricopeptide (TPR) repeat protein